MYNSTITNVVAKFVPLSINNRSFREKNVKIEIGAQNKCALTNISCKFRVLSCEEENNRITLFLYVNDQIISGIEWSRIPIISSSLSTLSKANLPHSFNNNNNNNNRKKKKKRRQKQKRANNNNKQNGIWCTFSSKTFPIQLPENAILRAAITVPDQIRITNVHVNPQLNFINTNPMEQHLITSRMSLDQTTKQKDEEKIVKQKIANQKQIVGTVCFANFSLI